MSYHEGTRFVCCAKGCAAAICLTKDEERKLRRSHDWFYCPNGHAQHFAGKTDEEKKIAKLEAEIEDWRKSYSRAMALVADLRAEQRSLRSRLGAKTRKLRAVA